jgi:hypothetical protein
MDHLIRKFNGKRDPQKFDERANDLARLAKLSRAIRKHPTWLHLGSLENHKIFIPILIDRLEKNRLMVETRFAPPAIPGLEPVESYRISKELPSDRSSPFGTITLYSEMVRATAQPGRAKPDGCLHKADPVPAGSSRHVLVFIPAAPRFSDKFKDLLVQGGGNSVIDRFLFAIAEKAARSGKPLTLSVTLHQQPDYKRPDWRSP